MQTRSRAARPDAAADIAACRALLRNGSRTFLAASLLLPRRVRDPACALYAFCRTADDAVDAVEPGMAQASAVQALRARLDGLYGGRPHDAPADRALARVVDAYAIPRALPEALIDGFAWDAAGRQYETLDDLHDYAARVAGTVGAMMALLMGARSADALARACDLGVAMQLSNIARDVGEDARMGRLYLPRQWLREAGVDPDAWLARPLFGPAIGAVVARLLRAAEALYARVGDGVAQLPPACRPGINAARFLYAQIGDEVARRGMNSVDARAVVGAGRKVRVLAWALSSSLLPARRRTVGSAAMDAVAALPATRFLVDAAAVPGFAAQRQRRPTWNPTDRAVWVIDLFERLERLDQRRRGDRHHMPTGAV